MEFIPALHPSGRKQKDALWFAFQNDKMLVKVTEDEVSVPLLRDLEDLGVELVRTQYLGALDGIDCFAAELSPTEQATEENVYYGLYQLFGRLPESLYKTAVYAHQIIAWDRDHQFCGKCGAKMEEQPGERAKVCSQCDHSCYPRLSPAIMAGILKGDSILLAANKRFPQGFHSILAGFVEPGETLEECVIREVREEVGLEVKNLRYFSSQPWPFPNSLMIAFVMDYAGGEINVDGDEITSAGWYTAENLPRCPTGKLSLAGKLIDWFKAGASFK